MKKDTHTGQASVEYILVIAGALAILIPFTLVFLMQSQGTTRDTTKAEITYIGNDIITQIEYLYNTGGFSKRTLQHTLPSGVLSVNITPETNELAFYLKGTSQPEIMVFYAQVPIQGQFPNVDNFGNFVLVNKGGYVLLCTTTRCP